MSKLSDETAIRITVEVDASYCDINKIAFSAFYVNEKLNGFIFNKFNFIIVVRLLCLYLFIFSLIGIIINWYKYSRILVLILDLFLYSVCKFIPIIFFPIVSPYSIGKLLVIPPSI